MRAAVFERPGLPLVLRDVPIPAPGPGEVRLAVEACGVCRTDLHVVDGDLPFLGRPVIPGHQIVGRIDAVGAGVTAFARGDRAGVPWLGGTCGRCAFCAEERENLCDAPVFTGYQRDGGFAEYAVADARFVFPLPEHEPAEQIAPWLCAGLIGHRALRAAGPARRLGLYGFGAAAHLVIQVARHGGVEVYAFTRPGDAAAQAFARSLGAVWAGDSDAPGPEPLDAALIFAPAGGLVPAALAAVRKGGVVVCAGIHMSDIPSFPYRLLWEERTVTSVANLTRADAREFLALAPHVPIRTRVTTYPLERAPAALDDLRSGRLVGSVVVETGFVQM